MHELCVSIVPQKSRGIHAFANHRISKRKKYVCDKITDVFHKINQCPGTVINDDMEILVRFVSECMTDPAQLRASKIQDWNRDREQ